jgi:N-carbamoyl-L-amino-acid hydrolase
MPATDHDGATLGGELARIGFKGDAPVGKRPIHAMFELHSSRPDPRSEGVGYRRCHAWAGHSGTR